MTHRFSRRVANKKISRAASAIEALESRRLLTSLTVNGTNQSDDIQVTYHNLGGPFGLFYDFTVNGVTTSQNASAFGGNTITINGLSSGDDIWIKHVFTNDLVTVNPGQGDDTINVATGNFKDDIHGTVTIDQQPNQDHLFIDDSTDDDTDITVNSASISSGDARVVHNSSLSSVLLKVDDSSPAIRNVYVDESVPNMTIDMGGNGGANFVSFGAHDHVLESSAIPMTIIGSNWVRFFDSAGAGGRNFDITPTSAFGKTMIDVYEVSFIPRADPIANGYTFNITGGPALITTIEPCSGTVNVGSSDAPLDLANFVGGRVESHVRGATNIFDAGLAQSSPFLLSRPTTVQNVSKGDFVLLLWDANIDLRIREVGSNDTVFNIAQLVVDSDVVINGGAGDDILQTVNTNNHQFDLEDIFVGDTFFFDGGGGDNLLDLNDSNSSTQGNPTYRLQRGKLIKNGQELLAFDAPAASRINWVGSSANDQMFFAGAPGNRVTLNGGAGNDLFSTFDSDFGGGNLPLEGVGGLIIGGTGFDAITIDDTAGTGSLQYQLGGSSSVFNAFDFVFQANGQSQAITFTSDIDSIQIFEGSGGAMSILGSKPTALQMLVDCGAGNDTVVIGGGDLLSNGWVSTSLDGGAGTDSIQFDDVLNSVGGTYTLNNSSLTRGASQTIPYSAFETQRLDASERFDSGQFSIPNTINLNAFSGQTGSTTISAVGGRSTAINLPQGSWNNLSGALTVNAPGQTINVNDQNDTVKENYTLTATQLIRTVAPPGSGTKTINYSGVGALVLNMSTQTNQVVVNSTPAGMATTINDAGGVFNSYTLGGGNVGANLLGPVTVNGPGGSSNGAAFDNSLDTTPSMQTLNGGIFTDGQTHTINAVSSIVIQNGGGGGTLDIPRVTIYSEARDNGAAAVNIGAGNLDANILATLVVDGASTATVDDRLDTGNDGYVLDTAGGTSVRIHKNTPGAQTITLGLFSAANLQCNNGDNVITVNNTGPGVQIFSNGGNDRFDVLSTKPGFFDPIYTIGIDTGTENTSVSPFGDVVNVSGNANVQLLNHDTIRSLSVTGSNAKFIIPTGVACRAQGISLTGVIDLAGGALLSPAGGPSQATFRNQLIAGRNNGAWNGTSASGAINSSLAASSSLIDGVGYGLGSQIAPTTIGPFSIAAGDTLLRYTLDGDANLDHAVDTTDFNILAANFGQTGRIWSQSDFNYDGSDDTTDFNGLAVNFSKTLAASAPPASSLSQLFSSDRVIDTVL